MSRVKYVSLVGVERCGKGTVIDGIKSVFEESPYFVREPGTTALGEMLRTGMKPNDNDLPLAKTQLAHDLNKSMKLDPEGYFFMMMLQRTVLLQDFFGTNEARKIVSDRGHMCTFAYQLYAQGLIKSPGYKDMWLEYYKNKFAHVDDLHVLIDIRPEESLARKAGRANSDEFDAKSLEFISAVREGYKKSFELVSDIKGLGVCVVVDGSQSKEKVLADVAGLVKAHFE
jgi:thymidylate kinase